MDAPGDLAVSVASNVGCSNAALCCTSLLSIATNVTSLPPRAANVCRPRMPAPCETSRKRQRFLDKDGNGVAASKGKGSAPMGCPQAFHSAVELVLGCDSSLIRIPFGVPPLDAALGGGACKGLITHLCGGPHTGKSLLCSQLVAGAVSAAFTSAQCGNCEDFSKLQQESGAVVWWLVTSPSQTNVRQVVNALASVMSPEAGTNLPLDDEHTQKLHHMLKRVHIVSCSTATSLLGALRRCVDAKQRDGSGPDLVVVDDISTIAESAAVQCAAMRSLFVCELKALLSRIAVTAPRTAVVAVSGVTQVKRGNVPPSATGSGGVLVPGSYCPLRPGGSSLHASLGDVLLLVVPIDDASRAPGDRQEGVRVAVIQQPAAPAFVDVALPFYTYSH